MAKGDVRPTRSNYRGGSYGGSSYHHYDDEGRGESKKVWEWFEENFTANPTLDWLLSLDDKTCYWLIKGSIWRFGLLDIAIVSNPNTDSRARRLVIKKLNLDSWNKFHAHMIEAYNRMLAQREINEHQRAEEQQGEYAAYVAQREAERVRIRHDDYELVQPIVDMTVGMLASDLNQAFVSEIRIADQGDWIDDTVMAYDGGAGFGIEDRKAVGTKIQITLSLDLSNSMLYNDVAMEAVIAFRDIGLTLRELHNQHPEDLYTGFFTFSEDAWGDKYGKYVRALEMRDESKLPENSLAQFDPYAPSKLAQGVNGMFTGTDTWISPLLAGIEAWELNSSDPGAVRLDLILTDAVLEHPKDIRDADVIQERRNGVLTTVLLNFMPESDWLNSTLPKRCYQLRVYKDNIEGILRNVISEFVQAHI